MHRRLYGIVKISITWLLGYYDAVEFGLGKGEEAFVRATQVEPLDKLSTTWGTLKVGN